MHLLRLAAIRSVDRAAEVTFNDSMASVLEVGLGERTYPIHIGSEVLDGVRETLVTLRERKRPVALLVDAQVAERHGDAFDRVFEGVPRRALPGGETTKSLTALEQVYAFLADNRLDRTGALFIAGGGVIGDLGGFAAATYLRGIEFHQVPTTLLAMVDSSVGGKTGINIPAGKNLVGAFHQPAAVYIGTDFLKTLPRREFAAGMAEVIKYGLLADAELFRLLRDNPLKQESRGDPRPIIRQCCRIKAEIVADDEREQASSGGRALLNLGHTFAHAVEQTAGYGEYLHGEAVGLGLVMAAELSRHLGHLSERDVDRIRETVRAHELPVSLRAPLPAESLIAAMKRDKKVRGGRLRFVVMESLGRAATRDDIEDATVRDLWTTFGAV